MLFLRLIINLGYEGQGVVPESLVYVCLSISTLYSALSGWWVLLSFPVSIPYAINVLHPLHGCSYWEPLFENTLLIFSKVISFAGNRCASIVSRTVVLVCPSHSFSFN